MTVVVAIDASLLAVPNLATTKTQVEIIVQRINHWSGSTLATGLVQIVQLKDTFGIVALANCVPTGENVRAFLQLHELDSVYSSEDIRRSINTILDRAPFILDELGLEAQKCTCISISPELACIYKDQHPMLNSVSRLHLYSGTLRALASLLASTSAREAGPMFFASGIANSPSHPVRVRIQVDEIHLATGFSEIVGAFSVAGEIPFTCSMQESALTYGSGSLWNRASDAKGIFFAIITRALEIRRSAGSDENLEHIPRFAVGSEFWASLLRVRAGPNSQHGRLVLDTCARVILAIPKYELKPFFGKASSRHGSTEQSRRRTDSALAERTHIAKGHEALRLMVWRRASGMVELANVGPKNELAIEIGNAIQAIEFVYE